jgi:hypothetical protein
MRFLRFLGRWYLIATAAGAIVLSPDPRPVAWVLLVVVVAGNIWHRHKLAELRRRQPWGQPGWLPYPYPLPYPVAWYPPPAGASNVAVADQGSPGAQADPPPALPPGGEEEEGRGSSSVARMVAVALVALVAALGAGTLHPAPALAAEVASPTQASTAAPAITVPDPFNPWSWLFEHGFAGPAKAGMRKSLTVALNASQASFFTPQLDAQPRVQQLWKLLAAIADALLAVLILVGAALAIAGDVSYVEAKALAPRVVVAGVVMNLSLVIFGQLVGWSNAVVKGFLGLGDSSLGPAVSNVVSAVRTPIVLAVLLVVALVLLFANLFRLVVVLALAVGAPLLNVFGVLPATDGVARAWWRALAACLIAPAAQALLLVLGVWIAATGASPFAGVFGNPVWSGIVDGTMLIVILVLMAISPLWMLKRALGASHQHMVAAFRLGRRAVGVMS